jgi:hypothetical protein
VNEKRNGETFIAVKAKKMEKVKQFHYRPGEAVKFPGV